MRIELDPIALDLTASAEASEGEPRRREIGGQIVPYGVEARIQGRRVTFARDSVAVDGGPLLLGHDPNRPVGVLTDASSSGDGLRATFAIDPTPDGDAALAQARSGSRRGLSVGVDLEEFETDPADPDRITVLAGRLAETSLVAMAAYTSAGVDHVAAEKSTHGEDDPMSETTPNPAEPVEPETDDDDDDTATEPESVKASRQRRPLLLAERGEPEMRFGEYVQTLVKAERGDRAARDRIEAALTREVIGNNPGVIPIAYVNQVLDSLGAARPLYDAMNHAEMPPSGMTIRRPEVTTRPDGGFLADDTATTPSGAVAITNLDVTVKQWAWGGSASVALVERSSPSYVEEVFQQAVASYYRDVEADIATAVVAVAAGTATSIGEAVAEFLAAYREYPNLIVCGGVAYGKLLDATGILMMTSGSADAAGNAQYAGMDVVASPDVTAGDAWLTRSDFQEIRETTPIRLSVSDVSSLSLEIGVTSFYARTPTRQTLGGVGGAVHLPGFVPVGTQAASSSRSKS